MSCYEWEEGTITLPTAEAPRVRDAVKAAADAHRKLLYDHAQRFWKELPAAYRRDTDKYTTAVQKYVGGNAGGDSWNPVDPKLPAWRGLRTGETRHGLEDDLSSLLGWAILHHYEPVTRTWTNYDGIERTSTTQEWRDNPPRRVQQKDVEKIVGKTTGASFTVNCGEPSISFKGRKVTWSVPENNRARDHGRSHPIAQVFFKALDRVNWTRGSGGDIVGNDEYSRDSRDAGGGGNYVLDSYGPAGSWPWPRPKPSLYSGRVSRW